MRISILSAAQSSHTYKWVKGIAEKQIDILLISFGNEGKYNYSNLPRVTLKVYEVAGDKLNSSKSKLSALRYLPEIRKEVSAFSPDIIHAHYASSYGIVASFLRRQNFIVSVWGSDVIEFPKRSFIHKMLLKYVFKKAKLVQCTSQNLKEEVALYTKTNSEIVPFGVNVNLFKDKNLNKDYSVITIGVVKGLEKIYGVDTLVNSLIKLRARGYNNLRLVVVGDGSEMENYRNLVNSNNVSDFVKFTGYVRNDLVPDFYNKFDLAVIPSLRESFGLSLLEAMSSEVPVIASRISGFTEVANDDIITYFDPGSVEDLVQKIAEYIADKDSAEEKVALARAHVEQFYSAKKCLNQQLNIYKHILGANG
mgnify:CR=1 FL=1|tara:strand:- start:2604 stop:3698 length:1095 start_codon:yes stop_codon:yes gene_type:complete